MKNIKDYLDRCSTYMFIGGIGKDLSNEKMIEEDMCLFMHGIEMLPQVKSQVDCDCPKVANKKNYTIDVVIKAEDGYLPIELKHSISATREEVEEDILKLDFYTQHYSDMPCGLLIYYTDKKDDPIKEILKPSIAIDENNRRYYYLLVKRQNDSQGISFEQRWDAKI